MRPGHMGAQPAYRARQKEEAAASSWGINRGDKYWYEFGSFESADKWKIDKPKINSTLERESNLKMLHVCEVFSLEKACKFVDELPDEINLAGNKSWEKEYKEI